MIDIYLLDVLFIYQDFKTYCICHWIKFVNL